MIFVVACAALAVLSNVCTTKKKEKRLTKFDSAGWIADKNGCSGARLLMKKQLLASKHNLRGFKTDRIIEYLGKPDAQELNDRGQQHYIYFLEPGPNCEQPVDRPQALFVRFSAVGIASEFVIKPL